MPRTPPAWVLEGGKVTAETKARWVAETGVPNPFALKREIDAGLRKMARIRRLDG